MRITQSLSQSQFLAALNTLQSNLADTQNQLSTNQSFTTAAQNPTAAGAVNNYNQALAQSQQYDVNAKSAQSNLGTEDNALSQTQTLLQNLRTLALEANNANLSSSDLSAIATQVNQIQAGLVNLANTQNGNGEYIFGGYAATTQPFSASAGGATYNGDQGQRLVQIAAGLTVSDGDPGSTVFNQIKNGNGTFAVGAATTNTGGAIVGATTVSDPTAYDGQPYTLKFTSPTTYSVTDAANGVVTSGTYTDGQSISFKGIQIAISGTPAANDSFAVTPSVNQSVFTTVQNLSQALNLGVSSPASRTQLHNSIAEAINNLDQALTKTADVRSSIGGRLNAITTQLSVSSSQQISLQSSISSLQGLDYAKAITTLDQQNVTLSAAMRAYTLTQGLSLFKYL